MASRPTPHSISLCALMVLHYEGVTEDDNNNNDDNQGVDPLAAAEAMAVSPLYKALLMNNDDSINNSSSSNDPPSIRTSALVRETVRDVEAFLQAMLLQQGHVTNVVENRTATNNNSSQDPGRLPQWSRTQDTSVDALIQTFRNNVRHESLVQAFLQWLSVASQSLDSLMDLVSTLQQSVTDSNPIIDPTSVSGLYIRSVCCLGFPMLSFSETGRLWKHFHQQVQEALQSNNNNYNKDKTNGMANDDSNYSDKDTWTLSPDQMERLLRNECQRMEFPSVTTTSSSIPDSLKIEHGLLQILKDHPELPSAHFMRFLHCLRAKERVGAMDALHAYFDYVLIQRRQQHQQGSSDSGAADDVNDTAARQLAAEHQQILQFAAILLASLHYEAGDVALARLATEEAVRVAQQSQDAAGCVAYSLGWLSQTAESMEHGGPATDEAAAQEWMARCVDRAVEGGNLRSLVAGANLSRVRQTLLEHSLDRNHQHHNNGSLGSADPSASSSPQTAWNLLSAASTTESLETAAATTHFIPPHDRPVHMTHVPHSDAALRISAQQRVLASAIWDAYNQSTASGLFSWLALQHHHGGNSNTSCLLANNYVAAAIQNVARSALYGSQQPMLRGITSALPQTGKKTMASCVYGQALWQMSVLRQSFGLLSSSAQHTDFSQEMALISHEWALCRGDLSDAQAYMRFLLSNLKPRSSNQTVTAFSIDVYIQQGMLYAAQGQWDNAKQVLKKQLTVSKEARLPQSTAWVLLRLGLVLMDATATSSHRPSLSSQNGAAHALPYLLECLTVCDEHGMDGLHAMAISVLSLIYLRLHRVEVAAAMLQACLPNLLQQGHIWYQALAYLTLARCHLQMAKVTPAAQTKKFGKSKKKTSFLNMALQSLSHSQELFAKCQDGWKLQEVFYLQANVWNELCSLAIENGKDSSSEQQQRDEASKRFLYVQGYLAVASRATTNSIGHFDNQALKWDDPTEWEQFTHRGYLQ